MRHLDDGVLRHMLDEPLAISDSARRHIVACPRCRLASERVRVDKDNVAKLLMTPKANVDVAHALHIVRGRLREEPDGSTVVRSLVDLVTFRKRTSSVWWSYRFVRPVGAAVGIAAIAAAVVLTPASSWAQNLLSVFQPDQVVAIQLNPNDLQTLPKLGDYGVVSQPPKLQTVHVNDIEAASHTGGMQVLKPSKLPDDVTGSPRYLVIPAETSTFTFSAQKAAVAAAAAGKPAPRFPANMDGSSLMVSVGPVAVTVFGGPENLDASANASLEPRSKQPGSPEQVKASQNSGGASLPSVVIAQAKAPVVTSTGVSVAQLEQFLLDQPGVSPNLAKAIKSIGDPSNPIPLPIPIVRGSSHPIRVHGVPGVAISDPTGLNAIVWEKDGVVYNVGGTLSEGELLTIAASLT